MAREFRLPRTDRIAHSLGIQRAGYATRGLEQRLGRRVFPDRGAANRDDRVTRVQAQLGSLDTGPDADTWLLAVYDAALVELCRALGVAHSLVDDGVCSESERLRVELELLSSVLPLG
jgi:hypothetical protein